MFILVIFKVIINLLNFVNFLVINLSKIQLSYFFVLFGIDIGYLIVINWRMGWFGEFKIVLFMVGVFVGMIEMLSLRGIVYICVLYGFYIMMILEQLDFLYFSLEF